MVHRVCWMEMNDSSSYDASCYWTEVTDSSSYGASCVLVGSD